MLHTFRQWCPGGADHENRRCWILPVCSARDRTRLVGIITDRDLCLEIVAEACDPNGITVESSMTREPVTCRADDPLETALSRMEANQIRRIPVIDLNGTLVGIIAQADIATPVRSAKKTAEVLRRSRAHRAPTCSSAQSWSASASSNNSNSLIPPAAANAVSAANRKRAFSFARIVSCDPSPDSYQISDSRVNRTRDEHAVLTHNQG